MQITAQPGSLQSVWTQQTPFFASPEIPQTVVPETYGINVNASTVFTANQPAHWSATSGTIVPSADSLTATYTAPGTPGSATITATNENDPADIATALIQFVSAPSPTSNTVQVYGPDSGVYGDGPFILQG